MRDTFDSVEARDGRLVHPPPVDIFEEKDNVVLVADLPGLTAEDFDLSVENRTLTLSGERKFPLKPRTARLSARNVQPWTIHPDLLPASTTVDISKIQAEFGSGVLRVTLPKAEDSRPRKIQVTSH